MPDQICHTAPAAPSKGPLHGLRVIDAGQMIAAPLACTMMADFGAEVIKIEHPVQGDAMRSRPPEKDGKSLWWKVIARNKRNVTLNLSKPEGQALLKRLVEHADILVENYRPGTFERWGLGYEDLAKINPRLVMVRVSGYGQTGPYAQRGGYGTVAEAFTGLPSFTGFPDGAPTLSSSYAQADSVASTFAVMGAMFGIYERLRSGKGQEVDVSLYEPLFRLIEFQAIAYDQIGMVRERIGNRSTTDSPRNAYRTRDDRYITISASTQKSFNRLVEAMGMAELATDPRFTDGLLRQRNADVLDQIMTGWFLRHDFDHALKILEEGEVVAGPILTIADIFQDPHYAARETIVPVPDPHFGTVRMQNAIPRMSRTPGRVHRTGGELGEENEAIWLDELGLPREEYDRLRAAKVI
ncbi:CoA transferase [Roseococcus sp. SYP-B2431]|uniref:CaiB/BaiF CoA transferase family protein n=1 Tax=Roseococcus sp. SYP-B2431 TaxID=2496640 RepID=UPI00103C9200|nr:CoA transferase [Roseococcus sp. SYP-B2431]TCH99979.1 CoA transferase [Roseococcus sp. SYP-B2431]